MIVGILSLGFETPMGLSQKRVRMITQRFSSVSRASEARRLWRARALAFLEPMGGALFELNDAPKGAGELADRLRFLEFRADGIAKSYKSHPRKLKQSSNSHELAPSGKIRALKESNLPRSRLSSYMDEGSSVSLLKASKKDFKGLAPAIRFYFAFCELMGDSIPPHRSVSRPIGSLFLRTELHINNTRSRYARFSIFRTIRLNGRPGRFSIPITAFD